MKIVGIFAVVNLNLTAVKFKENKKNEFRLLFDNWLDPIYLYNFFDENKSDLQSGFFGDITVDEAVEYTIQESEEMEAYIIEVAKTGSLDFQNTLHDLVFTPLHKNDYSVQLLPSKAYGRTRPSWLRLYAIEIDPNQYVVSGGAIKLTETMNERSHLKRELKKMEVTQEYLKENNLFTKDDLESFEIRY